MFSPGKLKFDASLFMFRMESKLYDEISTAWYQTSGKYDKNSVGRMLANEKYKNDLVRASIDNSLIFLPTDNNVDNEISEDVVGHLILISKGDVIKAIGIVVSIVECPENFIDCARLLMIHVMSTFDSALDISVPFVQVDHLPTGMMKLSEFVADKIDIGTDGLSLTHEYERHILFSRSYQNMLERMMNHETPVKELENERKKRIIALLFHLEHKKSIAFPAFRQKKYSLKNIVKLFDRYRTKC